MTTSDTVLPDLEAAVAQEVSDINTRRPLARFVRPVEKPAEPTSQPTEMTAPLPAPLPVILSELRAWLDTRFDDLEGRLVAHIAEVERLLGRG